MDLNDHDEGLAGLCYDVSMMEPTPRTSRLALTAGFVALAVIGGGGFLLGQQSAGPQPVAPAPVPVAPTPAPSPTEANDTLGRAELMALAATAADATASGTGVPAEIRAAVGKPFAILLPFGCTGPAAADSDAAMRWRYDDADKALRLHVAPVTWNAADWWQAGSANEVESVEGFWIPRPWSSSETCPPLGDPAGASGAEPVTLPGQTLAIGHLYGADARRQGRRDGKAYTAVIRTTPDAVRGEQGFRLRIKGRVAAGPDGNAAVCRQPGGAEQRPVCMIVTSLDEIALENTATEKVLATWPIGQARADD